MTRWSARSKERTRWSRMRHLRNGAAKTRRNRRAEFRDSRNAASRSRWRMRIATTARSEAAPASPSSRKVGRAREEDPSCPWSRTSEFYLTRTPMCLRNRCKRPTPRGLRAPRNPSISRRITVLVIRQSPTRRPSETLAVDRAIWLVIFIRGLEIRRRG